MNRSFPSYLAKTGPATFMVACVATGWIAVARYMTHVPVAKPDPTSIMHMPYDAAQKDKDIAFHEGRVSRDPVGAIGWAMLSGAYLARSRESDSYADAVKSENAARKSLSLRTLGNLGGQTKLVDSLLQQHRFKEALEADERALKLWGTEPTLNELHMSVLMELGRYDDAERVLKTSPAAFDYPPGLAIVSRFYLIKGKPDIALGYLQKAYAQVDANSNSSSESLAWFEEKIGECLELMGRTADAERAFKQALSLYPRDYKSYGHLCRLASGRQDWAAAISYGESSDAIAPMPDYRALVGDAYAQLGNRAEAEKWYAAVVTLAGKPGGPNDGMHEFAGASGGHGHTLDRQYAMFCADHDRDLDGAYACVLREMQARRDIYAYDTLAWVCLKRGDAAEAKAAIDISLKQGTQDAQLFYHAARIYEANRDHASATSFMRRALQQNPQFNALQARDAQMFLAANGHAAETASGSESATHQAAWAGSGRGAGHSAGSED